MIDRNTCGNAHGTSALLRPNGNTVHGSGSIRQHAQHTVLRFLTRGQGCAARGTIGYAVCGRIGGYETGVRETGEAQRTHPDATLKCRIEGFGAVHLVHAHAVANEIKHILGTLLSKSRSYQQKSSQRKQKQFFSHIYIVFGNSCFVSESLFIPRPVSCYADGNSESARAGSYGRCAYISPWW